jgi:hypothetical protein
MVEAVGYIREIYEHLFGDMSRQLTSVSLKTPLERYCYTTLLVSVHIEKGRTTVDPVRQ